MEKTSLATVREEELEAISAGQTLSLSKLHFGNRYVVQTNTAAQIGVAIGGSIVQTINQSNAAL